MNKNKRIYILFFSLFLLLVLSSIGVYRYIVYKEFINAAPYDVLISDISPTSATISWKTDVETPTYILLGDNEKMLGNDKYTQFHRITLSGLKEYSTYSFSISDGSRIWKVPKENSEYLIAFALNEFVFNTIKSEEQIKLPQVEELNVLPNEIIYVVLKNGNKFSDIRSYKANRFGGIVVDRTSFNNISEGDIEILPVEYFESDKNISLLNNVYAGEINCNQNVSAQSIDGISKEDFANLATRWVAGRGKHYALECFNDVVYRAKAKGVDPAFALTIWLNESGASNYTQSATNSGLIEDFGIHGNPSVPVENFSKQINYFLSLNHTFSCDGLSKWEAWGNMYRWGDCNENDPIKRQVGIDYYKGIETVYGLITNGRKLPDKVTGLPPSGENENSDNDTVTEGSLCCALKIDNDDRFQGDYENGVDGKSCEDVWKVGRNVYGGKLEYSVEIKGKGKTSCEVKYEGVCCNISGVQKWYPKLLCNEIVPNVYSSKSCTQNISEEKRCYFKDAKYQWLTLSTGEDYVKDVTSQKECEEMNRILRYKISLQKGVNFVGFSFNPMYKGFPMLASNLIEKENDILLIGNFENYGWKDLIKKSEKLPFAGEDFTFEQNKGYLLVSSNDITIEFEGWKKSSTQYLELSNGWNLVGGDTYTRSYNVSSLINSLEKNGIFVDTVGVWNTQSGMFDYRKEDENNTYGEDIRLEGNQGIFLRSLNR